MSAPRNGLMVTAYPRSFASMFRRAALLIVCSGWPTSSRATEPIVVPRPIMLTVDEEDSLQPGWLAHFEAESARTHDFRVSRLAALYVPQHAPPATFIDPGPFRATFSGWLDVELPGRYALRALGRGTVTLAINGLTLYEQLELNPHSGAPLIWTHMPGGMHRLELTYQSPQRGDGQLQLLWRDETFAEEPLPPERLFHDSRHAGLRSQTQLRRGRDLMSELRCLRCHRIAQATNNSVSASFSRPAPGLQGSGERFQSDWLFHWLLEPHALRDDASMPELWADRPEEERRRAAADIVARLTQAERTERAADNGPVQVDAPAALDSGRRHFESLGCISCHRLAGPAADDPYRRISLERVPQKYRPGQLAAFLLDPQRHDPWRAMPSFRLSDDEAHELEAYLRTAAPPAQPSAAELATADPERGAVLFAQSGCAACHGPLSPDEAESTAAAALAPSLSARTYTNGCLVDAGSAPSGAPQFRFSQSDLLALRTFVAAGTPSLTQDEMSEAAERLIERLRCTQCHSRDDWTSVWPEVMAEEGSEGTLPESVPSLTWTGEKLQVVWARRLIAGEPDTRARPWLKARMPSFPAFAGVIAQGLARQHGFSADARLGPPPPPGHIELGERLIGRQEGFFCIECHAVGARAASGAFAHHGVNFDQVGLRLNYDFFLRWITSPARVDPGTKMPTFSPDGQRTAKIQILDGQADVQFQAIWHYLRSLAHEDTDGRNADAAAGTRTHD